MEDHLVAARCMRTVKQGEEQLPDRAAFQRTFAHAMELWQRQGDNSLILKAWDAFERRDTTPNGKITSTNCWDL